MRPWLGCPAQQLGRSFNIWAGDPALDSLPFGEEQRGQKIYEAKNYSHESKNLEVLNFWIHWSNLQAPLSKLQSLRLSDSNISD